MTTSAPVDSPRGSKELQNAVARGKLQERPFPRLLHQLFGKRLTGCLEITDDSGDQSRVYLREGAPVHVERPNDIDRLDQVLTEAGLVSPAVISELSAALPPGRRLGEVLIEQGLLTAAALADALKLQMRRKLLRLFFPRRGDFAIYLDSHPYGAGDEYREMRVDPRCLMYPGLRAAYDEMRLRIELAPLVNHRFRLLPTLPTALLEAMGFRLDDATVVALQTRPHTLGDLPVPTTKGLDCLSVVLALLYTDLLEATPVVAATPAGTGTTGTYAVPSMSASGVYPVVAPRQQGSYLAVPGSQGRQTGTFPAPPAGSFNPRQSGTFPAAAAASPGQTGTHPVVPASQTAPAAGGDNLGQRLDQLVARLGTISHFDLLGVSATATFDEVNSAYLQQMRQYHPDRLAGAGLRDAAEKAARLVAQMNEAHAVLSDARRRAEYVAARAATAAGTPTAAEQGRALINSEEQFGKGEAFMRKGDFTRAAEAFGAAMKGSPAEPIYRAHWAYARFESQSPGPARDRLVRETLRLLDDVRRERPKFAPVLFWMGLCHKHLGDMTSAEASFKAAVDKDKTLLEAERELRVIEMRRQRAPVAAAAPAHATAEKTSTASTAARQKSIFGKFLNKK
jgi:curved DNA-binding protein CbpA